MQSKRVLALRGLNMKEKWEAVDLLCLIVC